MFFDDESARFEFYGLPGAPTAVSFVKMKIEPGQQPIELDRKGEMVVREAQMGVVLKPDIAFSIGKWLMEKAKEAGFVELKPQPSQSSSLAS